MGGPIQKDKAFFFGNYEGLRQARTGEADPARVPDENIHRGILPNGTQVPIAPTVKPYLDLWPLPNGLHLGNGVGQQLTPVTNVTNENFFVTRGDYYITPNQTLFSRFTYDNGDDRVPASLDISDTVIVSRMRYATLQYERIMSPTLLSTSRAAFNRTNISPTIELNIDYPKSLFFLHHNYPPSVGYTGVTSLAVSPNDTTYRIQNLWQFSQALAYNRGGHSIKFGGNFQKVGFNTSGPAAGAFGSFSWRNAEDFLRDAPLRAFIVEVPGSSTTRTVRQRVLGLYFQDDWRMRPNFTLNHGLRYEPWSGPSEKWDRVSTIKRWIEATEYDTPETGAKTYFDSPGEKAFSPRVGFAWDVKGDGKTAVRAGFGIFHVIILSNYLNTVSRKNPPYAATISNSPATTNLAGAAAYALVAGPPLLSAKLNPNGLDALAEFIQWDLDPSYDIKFNLSVEQEIAPNFSVSWGYVGTRGNHLFRLADGNAVPPILVDGRPFVPAGTPRLNRYLDQATVRNSDGKSFYSGMLLEVKKRLSQGFQLQGSYTWSKNIDDSTTGVALTDYNEGAASQPYGTKADRGLSSLHLGQNLVINGLWSLPAPASSGLASYLFGGWQVSGIFSASSGAPFSVQVADRNAPDLSRSRGGQRPDLVAGRKNSNITSGTTVGCTFVNGVPGPIDPSYKTDRTVAARTVEAGRKLGTPDLYYDPCAFFLPPAGFYGNAGRSILIGPGFANVDFSILKTTPVGANEGSQLQFHADFFNLFNRANFGRPSINVLNAASGANRGQLIAGAGQITGTVGRERQIQFGLTLIF